MKTPTEVVFSQPERFIPSGAPPLPRPRDYRPKIGLVGCGNIAASHLEAYRSEGWDVVALCDSRPDAAARRGAAYYPDAALHKDYRALIDSPGIDVVDVAMHAEQRVPVIEAALQSGKHVLSQKPLALDLSTAHRLDELAQRNRVQLAVNQNGRWAPYMSYLRYLCESGHLGSLQSVQVNINWDHTWIKGMDFERIHHVVLFDFAIHWIDFVRLCFGEQSARAAFATVRAALNTQIAAPLVAAATIAFDHGVASLLFNGNAAPGPRESITLIGDTGTVHASGELHAADDIEAITRSGRTRPILEGSWYCDGFRGAMGELLCAIEEQRAPANSAADNIRTLELLFALVGSADSGEARRPGEVHRVSDTCRIEDSGVITESIPLTMPSDSTPFG